MNIYIKYGLLCIGIIFGSNGLHAQYLAETNASDESVLKYQKIINLNKNTVDFIERTLTENKLPLHLRNLAMIESSFNTNSVSVAGATGVWQLMVSHASQYGLTAHKRNDLAKSTKVVMKSLTNLYNKYANWVTVIAAYNCGEGNIEKAMEIANSDKYHRFYHYLPNETKKHVIKYLEACYATNELDLVLQDYNTSISGTSTLKVQENTYSKVDHSLIKTDINAGYNFKIIAEELNIELKDLLRWNPKIIEDLNSKGEANFFLPTDLMSEFNMKKNKILRRSLTEKVG